MNLGTEVRDDLDAEPGNGAFDRRTELLDVAVRVIAERGLEACTFRTLAREAGTSTMSFTYAFKSRDGLLQAVIHRCGDALWNLRRLDEDFPDEPLRRFREIAMTGCQLEEEINPHLRTYDLMLIAAPQNAAIAEALGHTEARILDRYVRIVRQAQDLGQIPPEIDPADLCFQIWSLGDGLSLQRFAHPEQFGPDRVRQLFTEGFDSLVSGSGRRGR